MSSRDPASVAKLSIDLNLDAGEDLLGIAEGNGECLLYPLVSSLNIACGGHVGDAASIRKVLRFVRALSEQSLINFALGAHPSFPDRENFGRIKMTLPFSELKTALQQQLDLIQKVFSSEGQKLTHIKPHGALYNLAAQDAEWAEFLMDCLAPYELPIVVLQNSVIHKSCLKQNIACLGEAFVDRAYTENGFLKPRSEVGALILDPTLAALQALKLAKTADTLCIHSDTKGAFALAQAVRTGLICEGYQILPSHALKSCTPIIVP